jgi:pimeloyl-ACP methyl ester carboxylesterase
VARAHPWLGRFAYSFRYKAPTQAGAPVLVNLPGGPGETSMGGPPDFLPAGWGYLLTDPRGVGCNRLAQLPSGSRATAFYQTKELAADVVAAIRTLEEGQSYVLFGASYGSVLGQTVATLLDQEQLAAPQAVVLEGVMGRAYLPEYVGAGYIEQWERLRPALPDDVRGELDGNPAPYGLDVTTWSRALAALLRASPAATLQALSALASSDPDARGQAREVVRQAGSEQRETPEQRELHRQISCREIVDTTPDNGLDVMFANGHLVRNQAQEGSLCRHLRVTAPFDALATQFPARVYYFVGEDDVATPPWQSAYAHDNNEDNSTRVLVKTAGHSSLSVSQRACAPALLTSMAASGAHFAQLLSTCPLAAEVDAR